MEELDNASTNVRTKSAYSFFQDVLASASLAKLRDAGVFNGLSPEELTGMKLSKNQAEAIAEADFFFSSTTDARSKSYEIG